jgi:hypothetical protein
MTRSENEETQAAIIQMEVANIKPFPPLAPGSTKAVSAGGQTGAIDPNADMGPSPKAAGHALMGRAEFPMLGVFLTGERVERRLAAVLAADVAGYSRLMGSNEEGTLARLKAVRKTLVDPTIASIVGASSRQPVTECWSSLPAPSMRYGVPLKSSAAWPTRMHQCRKIRG